MDKVNKPRCKFCGSENLSSLGFFCDDCDKEQDLGKITYPTDNQYEQP